jgi:hypothetical protein
LRHCTTATTPAAAASRSVVSLTSPPVRLHATAEQLRQLATQANVLDRLPLDRLRLNFAEQVARWRVLTEQHRRQLAFAVPRHARARARALWFCFNQSGFNQRGFHWIYSIHFHFCLCALPAFCQRIKTRNLSTSKFSLACGQTQNTRAFISVLTHAKTRMNKGQNIYRQKLARISHLSLVGGMVCRKKSRFYSLVWRT